MKTWLYALVAGLFFWGQTERVYAAYTETLLPDGLSVNLRTDYGVDGRGTADDSAELQQAIDDLAGQGGGRIDIPAGKYRLAGVKLESNVHLFISKDAVLYPVLNKSRKGAVIFTMGMGAGRIANTSIRGADGKFTVEMPGGGVRAKFLVICNVENFLIENFHIKDNLSVFSSISLNPYLERPALYAMPENGAIHNGSVTGAQYGYGLIQAQAGRSVYFENLSGEGGVTLRLATGEKEMNDKQYGGLWDITAKDIQCKDGYAALLLGPHSMNNGVVVADGIRAEGCAFAMKGSDGFVSKKQRTSGLKPGKFAPGTCVKNIHAVFGTHAQLKTKDIRYLPEATRNYIRKKTESWGQVCRGPSVTGVLLYGDTIKVEKVTYEGFVGHPPVIRREDVLFSDAGNRMAEKKDTLD
ncbi:glycosyl hydrolase family 28-related protein [Pontiella agarivorans]|uniref:Glycosyl hydrolase family 28-related protein n=1 Tax=Pontiella agarivorans TaxID=3038953 RepID=A0ABU5MUE3_9BACT|nr:glycosyl hydrolase family 28-related protein [Pontiella agarivorans]MDZ8117839.1 glycosyl hydrolase family 28-related protein [Pontiella agarivorans]